MGQIKNIKLHIVTDIKVYLVKEVSASKLFVGQVPKEYTESDLRKIFEPYGEIHSLNLLLDKSTGQHKGCAFLTYFENDAAKAACEDLHEKRTLPGARNLLQVKPASSETSEDMRKLFVGMLTKDTTESQLRDMFAPYGTIEDLTILKASDGTSKGCAFIKLENRLQAAKAIRELHNSMTMEGMRAPMVVKLADSEKDKAAKRKIAEVGSSSVVGAPGASASGLGGAAAVLPGAVQPAAAAAAGISAGVSVLAQQVAYYQQVFAQLGLPQVIANAPGGLSGGLITQQLGQQLGQTLGQTIQTAQSSATRGLGSLGSFAAGTAAAGGYNTPTSAFGSTGLSGGDSTIQQAYAGVQQFISTVPSVYGNSAQVNTLGTHSSYTAGKKPGPENA